MKQLKRKIIRLCKEHYLAAEKGTLVDIKREDLYFINEILV